MLTFARCTIRLQGEEISSVLARQRKSSLRMASCIALFRLYETQPVIQVRHYQLLLIYTNHLVTIYRHVTHVWGLVGLWGQEGGHFEYEGRKGLILYYCSSESTVFDF